MPPGGAAVFVFLVAQGGDVGPLAWGGGVRLPARLSWPAGCESAEFEMMRSL